MRWPLLIVCFVFFCCKADHEKGGESTDREESTIESISSCENYILNNKPNNLNISILLDLSDRIDFSNQQIKDSAYILSIAKVFNAHIKDKKLGLLHDKIEVFFEPAPKNPRIFEYSENLKISYIKGVSKKEWIPKTFELYQKLPMKIYGLTKTDAKKSGFPGSDTWGFFNSHVKDYCIDPCRRNILIILTDGYLYHKNSKRDSANMTSYITPKMLSQLNLNRPDWMSKFQSDQLGFIPAAANLNDLEVLVLGLTNLNSDNPYTLNILEYYWGKWFEAMKVKKYKIKNADLPSNIETIIEEFIKG